MDKKELTFKEIWDTLYEIDVSKHTEKKMNLTYLSWSRAWTLLMKEYPQATYTFVDFEGVPYRALPDGTTEVATQIKIEDHVRSMLLPIMDHKNNAVENPNARQVNDNRMRCLVKNLAMFGLGMKVFTQFEDHLPDPDNDKKPVAKKKRVMDEKKLQQLAEAREKANATRKAKKEARLKAKQEVEEHTQKMIEEKQQEYVSQKVSKIKKQIDKEPVIIQKSSVSTEDIENIVSNAISKYDSDRIARKEEKRKKKEEAEKHKKINATIKKAQGKPLTPQEAGFFDSCFG